jgi:hypothetical protein
MKSSKCLACGYVGFSEVDSCKRCGGSLSPKLRMPSSRNPAYSQTHLVQRKF